MSFVWPHNIFKSCEHTHKRRVHLLHRHTQKNISHIYYNTKTLPPTRTQFNPATYNFNCTYTSTRCCGCSVAVLRLTRSSDRNLIYSFMCAIQLRCTIYRHNVYSGLYTHITDHYGAMVVVNWNEFKRKLPIKLIKFVIQRSAAQRTSAYIHILLVWYLFPVW